MLCEKCNIKEATIHLIKLINGEKNEVWLCEDCAREVAEIPLMTTNIQVNEVSLQKILGGFFEAVSNNKNSKAQKIQVVCKRCGLTYSQFKKSGQLGCSECYDSFADSLDIFIKRMQGNNEHIGKIPKITKSLYIEKKRINQLKREIQKCIDAEEYEKAAVLRDEINMIVNSKGGMTEDEKLD